MSGDQMNEAVEGHAPVGQRADRRPGEAPEGTVFMSRTKSFTRRTRELPANLARTWEAHAHRYVVEPRRGVGYTTVAQDFTSASQFQAPHLQAQGLTPIGQAIEEGIELLRQRKALYRQSGITYYRPWIFLITDGAPTDSGRQAAQAIANGETRKEFAFYAVGVDDADMDQLRQLAVRDPLKLKGLAFRELFAWLSSSLSSVSRSNPGDAVPLENPTGPKGWGSIS